MATNRRRRLASRRVELTRAQREHLLLGYALIPTGYRDGPDFDADDHEATRAAWETHRAELLGFWRQDPAEWAQTNRAGFGNPAPRGAGAIPWAEATFHDQEDQA